MSEGDRERRTRSGGPAERVARRRLFHGVLPLALAILAVITSLGAGAVSAAESRVEPAATIPTSITITVPKGWTWNPVFLDATISPVPEPPPGGSLELTFVFPGSGEERPRVFDGSGRAVDSMRLAAGDLQVYARFDGFGDHAASQSDTVTLHVGETTDVEITVEPDPAISSEPPTITAQVSPADPEVDGGTLVLRELTTDTTLGTLQVAAGQRTLKVTPDLKGGTYDLRATYSGHDRFSPMEVERKLWVRVGATATIGPATFYPVVDRFRDRLVVTGTRGLQVSAHIEVRSVPSDASDSLIVAVDIPAAPGPYRWTWDGMNGEDPAPIGQYDVLVTLDDGGSGPKLVTERIFLSHDWVSWERRRTNLAGARISLWGASRGGSISPSRSANPDGVVLSSARGFAAVVYAFRVAGSRFYGRMRFEVLGRSANGHRAVIAVWGPALGGYRDLGHYDAARQIGPGYRRWSTTTLGDGHVQDRTVRATVLVARGLGGPGPSRFDVRSVSLVYDIGTIHRVASAAAYGAPSLRKELRRALGRDGGRTLADLVGRRLPSVDESPVEVGSPDPESASDQDSDAVDVAGSRDEVTTTSPPQPDGLSEEPSAELAREPVPSETPSEVSVEAPGNDPVEPGPVEESEPEG